MDPTDEPGLSAPPKHRIRAMRRFALFVIVTILVAAAIRAGRYGSDSALIGALRRHDDSAALAALRLGASPNAQSYTEYWSPVDVFRELCAGRRYQRYSVSALMLASLGGRTKVVRDLVARGADVNQTTQRGDTALLYAVKYDRSDIVELLLSHGADPRSGNTFGDSAVGLAAKSGSARVRSLLEARGR